jgi:ABC-type uncharacterized transport system permease subunit
MSTTGVRQPRQTGFRSVLMRPPRTLVLSVVSVLLAFAIGAILIAGWGVNPITAYGALIEGALGNRNSLAETLVRAVPLALAGLGVALSFRGGVFNVGAEGQLYVGGIAAASAGVQLQTAPSIVALPSMFVAAFVAGALWSGLAGVLKLRFKADELITTIMLSYIAIFLVGYLLHGPLQDPDSPLGQTARLAPNEFLPIILPKTRLHAGLAIAVVLAVLAHLLLWRTTWGYRLRVVGLNARAGLNAGIDVRRSVMSVFLLSGGLAGLAGSAEVAGVQHRMIEGLSPGYGYTAIIVALLGQTTPYGVIAAALLFAILQVGATTMESVAHVPGTIATIIQGLVVLFLIGHGALDFLRRRWRRVAQTG